MQIGGLTLGPFSKFNPRSRWCLFTTFWVRMKSTIEMNNTLTDPTVMLSGHSGTG